MTERSSSSALSGVVAWGLAALVVAAPLAIGGTRAEAKIALSAGAVVLLMLAAYDAIGRRFDLPWPTWAPLGVAGLIGLQLVPLPIPWLEALSPFAHGIRERTLADLGAFDTAQPLSLDPRATWIGLFLQVGFVAVLLVAANLRGRARTRLTYALVAGGAAVSLIGLMHWIFGAPRIFWTYDALDRSAMSGYFATFVNNNTLAGYLALCGLVGLGLFARARRDLDQRVGLIGGGLCLAGVVLAGSRGGHIAVGLGAVVFAVLAHARTRAGEAGTTREQLVARAGLILVGVGVAAAIALLPDWRPNPWEAPETDGKIAAWGAAAEYARNFAWFGSGRDTFTFVYPHFQDVLVRGTVSHPENIVLQLATEIGYGGALIALVGGLLAWVYIARGRPRDPLQWGLVAGLAAVGLQQLVDFGFEAAGLAFPVAAALGVAVARAQPASTEQNRAGPVVLGLALALGGLLAWQAPGALTHAADRDAKAIADAEPEALDEIIRAAAIAHPADYVIALAAAERLAREPAARMRETLGWLNRAMAAFPRGAQANLLAARYLVRMGRLGQAAVEYRQAMLAAPWREPRVLREAAGVLTNPLHFERLLPPTDSAVRRLGNLLVQSGRHQTARAVMEGLLLTRPEHAEVHVILSRACHALRDFECEARQGDWLVENGRPAIGYAIRARVAARAGDGAATLAALEAAAQASGEDAAYLELAGKLYLQLGDIPQARRSLDRLWRAVAADDQRAARALSLRAQLEEKAGDQEAAFRAYAQAFARQPRLGWALRGARLAAAAGRTAEARELIAQARARWPDDAAARQKIDQVLATLGTD